MLSLCFRKRAAYVLAGVLVAVVVGCGGSGSGGAAVGEARMLVDWGGTRAAADAQSITLTLTNQGTEKAYEQILNRAPDQAQQAAIFQGLPAGDYIVTASAHDGANGQGSEVSSVATSLEVTHGNMSEVALELAGQIKDIVIPAAPVPTTGAPIKLIGFAVDVDGHAIMLPADQLQWSVDPSGLGATIDENGVLVVSAAGTVTVTLTDPGSGEQATVEVDVSNPTTSGGTGGETTGGTAGTSSTGATSGVTTGTTGSTS
jgi:hypothetical protein